MRAYLAMMRARRALIFRHPGHTTRRGTAARLRWMLRHRAPRRSPRYHLVRLRLVLALRTATAKASTGTAVLIAQRRLVLSSDDAQSGLICALR